MLRKDIQKRVAELKDQLQAYEDYCREIGQEPANVALAWMVQQPGVTSTIIGPRTMEHLTGVLRRA